MLPNYYDAEIPLQFNFVIVNQKALEGHLIEFILEFKILNSDYLCVFISMGSDMNLVLNWLDEKKISPENFYVDNELSFMDDRFPKLPRWLTIFRKDGKLFCQNQENKKKFFYTDFLEFNSGVSNIKGNK